MMSRECPMRTQRQSRCFHGVAAFKFPSSHVDDDSSLNLTACLKRWVRGDLREVAPECVCTQAPHPSNHHAPTFSSMTWDWGSCHRRRGRRGNLNAAMPSKHLDCRCVLIGHSGDIFQALEIYVRHPRTWTYTHTLKRHIPQITMHPPFQARCEIEGAVIAGVRGGGTRMPPRHPNT
jgi:hypothetical protein